MRALRALLITMVVVIGCHRDVVQTRVWPPPESRPEPAPATTSDETPAESPARAKETRVFDPSDAAPEAVVREVRAAMEKNRLTHAVDVAGAAIPRADVRTKARLHWLSARAEAMLDGRADAARAHWAAVSVLEHPLSKWAIYQLAATLEWTSPGEAARLASTLTDDWTGAWRARVLEARALARAGKTDEALPKLEKLLSEASPSRAAPSIAIPLAKIHDDAGRVDDAIRVYSRVAKLAPLTEAGEQSKRRLQELGEARHPQPRKRTSAKTRELLARADKLYAAKKYRPAEREYLRAARALRKRSELWCHAMDRRARAMLHRKQRTKGAPAMARVADRCGPEDRRAWSRYRAARAYGRLGQWSNAITQYEKLQQEAPAHRLADDAAYRRALADLERGKRDAYYERLAAIPERYPDGDMWEESLFRLGWDKMQDGDHSAAFKYFDELERRGASEPDEGMAGRAAYWRSRMLQRLNRNADAADGYAAIARKWPLRYYAQLSIKRLHEIDAERAKAVVVEMKAQEESRFVFAWRDEFDTEGFARAVELLAVDETTLATAEMRRLKMVGAGLDPEMAVIGAVLLHRARSEQRLSRFIRNHFQALQGLMPAGDGRLLWEVAYPQAFTPLIEQSARKENVPAPFVRAVAREESSFDPDAVSWARAYGLVQLLVPTAKRFSKGLGVRVSPNTLKNPRVNLRIGARYMAWLQRRFENNYALVPAAYNAGENAVKRWLSENDHRTLDVFVEEIPYDETRRYTRRVLQSYGVYTWLAQSTLPPLKDQLPNGVSR